MKIWFHTLFVVFLLPACLKTRSELQEGEKREKIQSSLQSLQQLSADNQARFEEVFTELRNFNGRIQNLESASKSTEGTETEQQLRTRVGLLQDGLEKADSRIIALEAEVAALRSIVVSKAGTSAVSKSGNQKSASDSKGSSFQVAEEAFKAKKWEDAILAYEKYRELNPKGANRAEAGYKIGVCFQELKMIAEAKTFFAEVASQFPNSDAAKKAKYRLSQIK